MTDVTVAAQLHDAMKSFGLTGNLRTNDDVDRAYKAFAERVGLAYDPAKTTFGDLLDAFERSKVIQ